MLSGGTVELMVSVKAFDALPEALSVTWTVKLDVPAVVGVPLIAPNVTFNLDGEIRIGNNVSIGPHVVMYTATHELVLRHRDVDHDQRIASRHDRVERLGLRHRPREPIQHEPRARIVAVEPLADDADHDLVVHQLPAVHDRLGGAPELGTVRHGFAQNVARRNPRNPAAPRQPFRLRPFACAGRSKNDQIQRHAIGGRHDVGRRQAVRTADHERQTTNVAITPTPFVHECASSS